MTKSRKQPLGQTIGGVLFGFEQQVLRTMPPGHELVHHARPDDPIPAGDGGFAVIVLPGETRVLPSETALASVPAPERATVAGADDPR